MAVEYEIVIQFAGKPVTSLCLSVDEGLISIYLRRA